ncbi:MAG: NAD(P)/FAD-dependent oxidoreductase [Candidatus Micrarchaeia archaeon]
MKVAIIGAGIIGLTLAKELALKGIDVVVYERKKEVAFGAEKASGVLSIKGLQRIGLNYRSAVLNVLDGAVLYAGKQILNVTAKEHKAYVIDRAKLVLNAYKDAEKAGAEVRLSENLSKKDLIKISRNSSILVGADGAVSATASTFGFPPISEYILTYKSVYKGAHIANIKKVELIFSKDIKGFFGWTVPYSAETLEVGVGVSSKAGTNSYSTFKNFLNNPIIRGHTKYAKIKNGYASLIPINTRKVTVKGNVALVGDAAGQIKASTGGGIIFGVTCAKILAESISKNAKPEEALKDYDKEWRRVLSIDLKLHRFARWYYTSLSLDNLERLFTISKILGIEGFLGKHGDMDSPSATLKSFFLRS